MDYTEEDVREAFNEFGEVMFVLDSDREYELHPPNVEHWGDDGFRAEGLNKETGDYEIVFIPYDTIEHHKTHKNV